MLEDWCLIGMNVAGFARFLTVTVGRHRQEKMRLAKVDGSGQRG